MQKFLRAVLIAGLLLSFTACTDKETGKAGIAGVPSAPKTGTVESSSLETGTSDPSSVTSQSETTGSSVVEWTPPETKYIDPDACYGDIEAAAGAIIPREYKESELKTYEFEGTGSIKVPKSFKLISEEKGDTATVLMFETDVENIRVFLIASPDLAAAKFSSPSALVQYEFSPKSSTGFRLFYPQIPVCIVGEKCPNLLKETKYYRALNCGFIKADTTYADDTYSVITARDDYFGAYASICTVDTTWEDNDCPAIALLVYNNSPTFTSDVCYTDLVPIAAALINEAVFS